MTKQRVKIGGSFTLNLGKGITILEMNEERTKTYQVFTVDGDEINAVLTHTNIFIMSESDQKPETFSLEDLLDLQKTKQVYLKSDFFEEEIEEVEAEEVDPDQLELFKQAEEVEKKAESKLDFNLDGMSKKEITAFGNELVKHVTDQEISATKMIARVTRVEALCKVLKGQAVKDEAIKEIESGINSTDSMSFTVYNTATKLSFDHFSGWSDLQDQAEPLEKALKEIKEKQKEIEERMTQAFKLGQSLLEEDSGELTPPAKYVSGGSQAIRTKF